ncbi:interferon-induced protein with tetratricopeptide repeats 3-like isoform X2 [Zalophus californianus]|uniref:Interferon-induced protein with tetratricopeptide repeats 3-like isoform X2 n=1 Tax=Zalophus californianus TaxID=9704 RepID=A0A6J2D8T6_ZALCA|nr:interferon-induced protein with tetratricopeptide repeats 3-like isoform X2 [Zalophus californianus]
MESSEANKDSLEKILPQLKCHFTWNLLKKDSVSGDLEDTVCHQIEFLNPESKATMYNFLAYIKHLNGHSEAALEHLRQAEELIQREHSDQAETRSLVTWGNYAWVYYHLGRHADARMYVDKVRQTCEKFSNPYSIECAELDCEEGWTRLKCGAKHNERAKVCFEKALAEKPNNPEFSSGLAIATYRLDNKRQTPFSMDALKQALELNPDNQYVKVLLALKLQMMNEEADGERLVLEALENTPCRTDVLRNAATFYQKKGDLDKAIELFLRASKFIPNNGYLYHQIACCYRAKVKQIQNTGESEATRNGEKIRELKQYAVDYVIKAIEKGVDPLYAYSDELLETEDYYQIACSKELPGTQRQQPCQHYRDFQGHHRKSEGTATQCDLEGLPTGTKATEEGKTEYPPQNTAGNQLPQNAPNSWYLQGLIHKLNDELQQALECYEKELGYLLRNSPTGIGSLLLPLAELEEGSEAVGRDPHNPTPRVPGTPSGNAEEGWEQSQGTRDTPGLL